MSLPLHTGNITYLDINISSRLSELFNLNYSPLLKKITDDLKRWNNLPLSLNGRIASVKMKILPQINYLFSMLPITPTDEWFKSLDTLTSYFDWKNKTPKISLAKLQKTKPQGGLEGPNFQHYFLANQLQYMIKWINKNSYTKLWIDLEQNQCNSTSIADLPFLPTSIKKMHYFKNITITSTLTAWWK